MFLDWKRRREARHDMRRGSIFPGKRGTYHNRLLLWRGREEHDMFSGRFWTQERGRAMIFSIGGLERGRDIEKASVYFGRRGET
jgi:hypothetical protein